MKATDFERKTPYYFSDLNVVFKKDGSLRQSKKLIKILKKQYSVKTVMAGIPKYFMRVDHFQMRKQDPCVLVAIPDLEGGYTLEFLQD